MTNQMDTDGYTGHAQALRTARRRFLRAGKRYAALLTLIDFHGVSEERDAFMAAYRALMAVE